SGLCPGWERRMRHDQQVSVRCHHVLSSLQCRAAVEFPVRMQKCCHNQVELLRCLPGGQVGSNEFSLALRNSLSTGRLGGTLDCHLRDVDPCDTPSVLG